MRRSQMSTRSPSDEYWLRRPLPLRRLFGLAFLGGSACSSGGISDCESSNVGSANFGVYFRPRFGLASSASVSSAMDFFFLGILHIFQNRSATVRRACFVDLL